MTLQNFDGKNDTITPEQVQYWDNKHLIHPWSEFSEDSFDMTQVSRADGIYPVSYTHLTLPTKA